MTDPQGSWSTLLSVLAICTGGSSKNVGSLSGLFPTRQGIVRRVCEILLGGSISICGAPSQKGRRQDRLGGAG